MVWRKYCLASLVTLVATGAFAQTQPAAAQTSTAAAQTPQASAEIDGGTPSYIKPETAEQRKARLGTNEDPGLNPDSSKNFYRFGRPFRIEKYERRWAEYKGVEEGWVRPFGPANFTNEIYQQNDKFVWVWVIEPTKEEVAAQSDQASQSASGFTPPQIAYLKKIQPEFVQLDVPLSDKTIRFEEASDGLPTDGSWRNSLAVADMNGDGFPDIIAPPQRGADGLPWIFLGDGKGHWRVWREVVWPFPIQYGSVVAADFNKDGKMDLAFAIHLTGVRVFLGDGKGHFVDSSKGLATDNFPTRRLRVADLDHDGWPDLLVISEGPTSRQIDKPTGKVLAFLNRKKGSQWEQVDAAAPPHVLGGDSLAVGKFNSDAYPDFVGGSVYYQASELIYRSTGLKKWEPVKSEGYIVPYLSYYNGLTTGRFSSKTLDDAIMSYSRYWPEVDPNSIPTPPLKTVVGLDRVTFSGKEPVRVPIIRFAGDRPVLGVATGDFDGDGNPDIIYVAYQPKREFVILLGDGKGGFKRARLEGITPEPNTNYDVTVADVNRDGRPDVIIGYESAKQTKLGVQDGSIHVFLNRGVVKGTDSKAAGK